MNLYLCFVGGGENVCFWTHFKSLHHVFISPKTIIKQKNQLTSLLSMREREMLRPYGMCVFRISHLHCNAYGIVKKATKQTITEQQNKQRKNSKQIGYFSS